MTHPRRGPISNTSAANLAAWFGRTLRERMAESWPLLNGKEMTVGVEQTTGQRGN
jgi:hypothetical protein